MSGQHRAHPPAPRRRPGGCAALVGGRGAGRTLQLVRFAVIGVLSTVAHLGLYLLLRGPLGPVAGNLVALLLTAVANTAANRRVTFGVHGPAGAARHQVQGLLVLGVGLALTSAALAGLGAWAPGSGPAAEVAVLVVANALATVLRFVTFRSWVFRPTPAPPVPRVPACAETDLISAPRWPAPIRVSRRARCGRRSAGPRRSR
ncbi:MAG: GtrA family protein [Pseudonocardia sp.]